ncbi:nuclear transport factor 2 family protein [Mesorhizobium sp.]|uniref:nuclear transport factor 2 family protein n=1 Tax=Mesorhizobium sp. TaxID=1871066 RepID=UPI000FE4F604|nr:nuclear transport factor 2 family protein [Mesorhizobium sp.]RWO42010.1 MAG: nuclear transport factor 2 family protein [Mesorhizobium sp.]TIN26233.1 MAG: nuclear transport factor 2 family protein [Mesorhizobium sp.]TIN38453.1 MAG: nuclear transport factor 2 family protein [Mesorhizobium sp.]TJU80587.1 MAG: nuclear transport factor 2 family protein [Mesorhizobium sp.]TJU89107.1 MAG: nuclear transport factor 2 family protein [Mesorhizobium sp.]
MDKPFDRRRTALELLENMFEAEMRFLQSGSESLDILASAFHAEVVVHEPQSLPYAGDWNGLDGVGALFRKMREIWSDVTVESLQAAQNDDMVFMSCTLALISRANGATIKQPFAEVLRFKDDRLIEGTPFYYDTSEILAILR